MPLYVRQTTSELTGEHTCVMVRGLNTSVESDLGWLREFVTGNFVHLSLFGLWPNVCLDFRRRFLSLLSYKFREIGSVTALSILEAANVGIKDEDGDKMKGTFLSRLVGRMIN